MNAVSTMNRDDLETAEREQSLYLARHKAPASGSRLVADTSTALLRTIAEVLDICRVFPQVSEIVKPVLPHDALVLVCLDRAGRVTLEARSGDDLPQHGWRSRADDQEYAILSDLRRPSSRLSGWEPTVADALVAAGYRSVLSVRGVAPNRVMQLEFLSRQVDAYTPADLPAAQHVADYVSLAVAHEQLAAAEGSRAEARGRSERFDARVRALADQGEPLPSHGRMIGRSEAWQRVLTRARRVAATDTTVFLQGESGTGKEVVARFIHQTSPRKDGPFVAINCAALPEQLLESELFGYERGAFTGAHQAKAGQIELASRGVLFLDEVSEMSLIAQAKFLRFLQEREFQRLGGTRTQKANVRIIAASNRDLRQAVEKGTFREDLFYRLQVFDIPLPRAPRAPQRRPAAGGAVPARGRRYDGPRPADASDGRGTGRAAGAQLAGQRARATQRPRTRRDSERRGRHRAPASVAAWKGGAGRAAARPGSHGAADDRKCAAPDRLEQDEDGTAAGADTDAAVRPASPIRAREPGRLDCPYSNRTCPVLVIQQIPLAT